MPPRIAQEYIVSDDATCKNSGKQVKERAHSPARFLDLKSGCLCRHFQGFHNDGLALAFRASDSRSGVPLESTLVRSDLVEAGFRV